MKSEAAHPLIAVFLMMSALCCESLVGPSTPTPEPTVSTYQGDWTGTTAAGLAVSFTVTGNSVTSFCVDLRNAFNDVISYASSDHATISGDGFNLKINPPVQENGPTIVISVSVHGSFSSPTAAAGSVTLQPPVAWTAQKNDSN